jgi:hypothetical protein
MVLRGGLLRVPASELILDITRVERHISNKYNNKKIIVIIKLIQMTLLKISLKI